MKKDGSQGEMKRVAGRIFSGLAISYDAVLDWTTLMQDRHWKKWAIQRAKPAPTDLVLDVGCGTCVTEELLRGLGCRVVGLDLTEEMLLLGKAKGLGVGLLRGDAESLPFPDDSFDLVLSFYVVKYCNLGRFVSESARVLKPGGRIVIYDFARPRGLAAPLLGAYTYGFLRIAGYLAKFLRSEASYTFQRLPGIVKETVWDFALPSAVSRHDLTVLEEVSLSGGAVRGFAMTKR